VTAGWNLKKVHQPNLCPGSCTASAPGMPVYTPRFSPSGADSPNISNGAGKVQDGVQSARAHGPTEQRRSERSITRRRGGAEGLVGGVRDSKPRSEKKSTNAIVQSHFVTVKASRPVLTHNRGEQPYCCATSFFFSHRAPHAVLCSGTAAFWVSDAAPFAVPTVVQGSSLCQSMHLGPLESLCPSQAAQTARPLLSILSCQAGRTSTSVFFGELGVRP